MTHDRTFSRFPSKLALTMLVIVPTCLMAVLTISTLLPTLKDPESKVYGSSIGYPALKRLLGQPIKVQTVAVSRQVLEDSVAAPGESVALQDVSISSLVSGTVEAVFVAEGDIVRKGQPLLRIAQAPFQDSIEAARAKVAIAESALRNVQESDPATLKLLEANVKSAQARLEIAEVQLNQLQSLQGEGAVSLTQLYERQDDYVQRQRELAVAQQELAQHQSQTTTDLETARSQLDSDKVTLQEAMRDLNNTVIYAPSDGLISRVNIHSGETTSINASVMTLTQDIVFKSYIDQARLDSIKLGEPATVRLVAYPGQVFEGKVVRLNPTVQTDASDQGNIGADRQYTYSAWVKIEGLEMPPGLQGYAEFGQASDRVVVPESAVTHLSAGEGMVMVAEADQAVVKRVGLGRVVDGQREILTGLQEGEQVVLFPRALNPGDQLKPQVAQALMNNP